MAIVLRRVLVVISYGRMVRSETGVVAEERRRKLVQTVRLLFVFSAAFLPAVWVSKERCFGELCLFGSLLCCCSGEATSQGNGLLRSRLVKATRLD